MALKAERVADPLIEAVALLPIGDLEDVACRMSVESFAVGEHEIVDPLGVPAEALLKILRPALAEAALLRGREVPELAGRAALSEREQGEVFLVARQRVAVRADRVDLVGTVLRRPSTYLRWSTRRHPVGKRMADTAGGLPDTG